MLTKRIIPCLDVKEGRVVKGTKFLQLRDAGDPVEQARAYVEGGLIHSLAIGTGQGPLCHWHPLLAAAEG